MTKRLIHCASLLITLLAVGIGIAQAQTTSAPANYTGRQATGKSELNFSSLLAQTWHSQRTGFSLMPISSGVRARFLFNIAPAASGPSLPVLGGGTLGRLTKWTGFTSSDSFIGDTTIFEDKNGLVGIGTDTPTSRLTVAGIVQSTSGGFKFPDGTVQTTSSAGAISTVTHDTTLTGSGTVASPLGVASPLMVRDLDNPARQPMQFATGCFRPDASFCTVDLPDSLIPQGKRLVIEYVSMNVDVPSGEVVFLFVSTIAGGNRVLHSLSPTPPAVGSSGAGGHTSVGQQVRLYADPGSIVSLGIRLSDPATASATFAVSGYLVDIP